MTPEYIFDCALSGFDDLLKQVTASPYENTVEFTQQAYLAADGLPLSIRKQLLEFYTHGNASGVLIFKTCPQEPNIDGITTPTLKSRKTSFVSETCLAILAARLGKIFGYPAIENGSLFQNVVPRQGSERKQSNASSSSKLRLHTEQHFHPHSPDYILLYCLRTTPGVKTYFVSVNQLVQYLDEQSIKILFEPLYRTGVDYIFGNHDEKPGNGPVESVLYGSRAAPFIRYDRDLMIGTTAQARKALNKVHKFFDEQQQHALLSAGDVLIIDNRRVVHGRSSFKANYDGMDRWLLRTKVLRNIDQAARDLCAEGINITTKFI